MSGQLKRTTLYEEHLALGAQMHSVAGFEMPVQYQGTAEEHLAVRSSAGVFDIGHMAEFRVFGFGAFDYLQGLLTNDLRKISAIGSAQYTLLCDEDGGVIDDLIVYHTGDLEYLIIANAANRETDLDWLRAHVDGGVTLIDGVESEHRPESGLVELADESGRTALIALQGPKALAIIRELAEPGFEPPARFSLSEAVLDTVPALLARTGYTGEDGVEILTHISLAPQLWRALLSFSEVTPCGLGTRDSLRLEMGYPSYGSDIDRGVDPISAGLGRVVARDKGEYVGREAIERVRTTGPVRRLTGLVVDEGVPQPGDSILHDGAEVGKVASGMFSPTRKTGIATAYLPVELIESETVLEVALRSKVAHATVTRLPFVQSTSLSATQV